MSSVAPSSEYGAGEDSACDLVIDPAVGERAAGKLRRAHERHALVEYGKEWQRDERPSDAHYLNQLWVAFFWYPGSGVTPSWARLFS
jgi:hypothetical protein